MLVAKYKFDKSVYENLIPVFNDGYNGYSITDEIDENNSNVTIRTIECDSLPTKMKFGDDAATDRELSLLEILDMNINEATSLRQMFMYCENLTSITCDWNINNEVTSLRQMFYNCKSLTLVDVSRWDTSNVNNIRQIFYNCENLTQIDVSNWNTSLVDDMNNMFYSCKSLTSIDMSNWNTSLVDDMNNMFYSCDNLIQLDLSNFNMTNISNTTDIFKLCSKLQYIRCNNTSTINTLAPLLYDRTSSTQGKIITTSSTNVDTTTLSSRNWSVDTSNGTKIAEYKFDKSIWNSFVPEFNEGYSGYFCNDVIEDEVNSPNVVTRELVGYGGLPTKIRLGGELLGNFIFTTYQNCLIEVPYLNIGTHITNMNGLFYHCEELISVNTDNWDTSNVTNMATACENCKSLTSLDVSNFDTKNVTNMFAMFNDCNKLTSLDVSNFDTNNVTSMDYMFRNCKNLTSLDVSNWNTSKVNNMYAMFANCQLLTSLDVSNWNTSNVTNMSFMFNNCTNLTSLDVSNWDTSNVKDMQQVFISCKSLSTLDLSNWNFNKVSTIQGIFHTTNKLKFLDLSNMHLTSHVNSSLILSNFEIDINSLGIDIGLLYSDKDTVNKIISSINGGHHTIWVKDTKASDYTATDYVTIKDYKEGNRTLYLNSPLLEGDEIVNKEGKLYHYHKMGSVVFDGSENWQLDNEKFQDGEDLIFYILPMKHKFEVECISDRLITKRIYRAMTSSEKDTNLISTNFDRPELIRIYLKEHNTLEKTKQWLSENPTTVVYELAEPYYELISDDPLIVQSYAEGKLDTSSIITPTSIQFVPYEEELTYLYTSTQYCIQFNSTANCTVDITLGGTKVESKSVKIGLNKIYITTPSELVDNKLIINAKGNATISEVVVVNSNVEFDYFDGLKSSFEDCLVTDVDNENYGKYEVGVKIVGKNKLSGTWELGGLIWNTGLNHDKETDRIRTDYIKVKPNTTYFIKGNINTVITHYFMYDNNKKFINFVHFTKGNGTFTTLENCYYIRFLNMTTTDVNINIQLEEGSTATPYEPYKETNATIYLNSPLLQGDRIEVKDGKLCHYHKMGMVVLDGSENWITQGTSESYPNGRYFYIRTTPYIKVAGKVICDTLPVIREGWSQFNTVCVCPHTQYDRLYLVNTFPTWLSENPITVVYELANPYYEDITPMQSSFVISTVSEGDMEILTDLPIKSNITYLTNITSAVLMEQQLDELDNGTESLTNILEDEINE